MPGHLHAECRSTWPKFGRLHWRFTRRRCRHCPGRDAARSRDHPRCYVGTCLQALRSHEREVPHRQDTRIRGQQLIETGVGVGVIAVAGGRRTSVGAGDRSGQRRPPPRSTRPPERPRFLLSFLSSTRGLASLPVAGSVKTKLKILTAGQVVGLPARAGLSGGVLPQRARGQPGSSCKSRVHFPPSRGTCTPGS